MNNYPRPPGFHFFFAGLTLAGLSVGAAPPSAKGDPLRDIRILSPEWICAVVDPTEAILQEREIRFADALAKDRADHERTLSEGRKGWYLEKSKQYRSLVIQADLHRRLFADFNRSDFWRINGKAPRETTVWAHSVDALPGERADDAPALDALPQSRVADMVYLRLPAPLKKSARISIEGGSFCSGSLSHHEESSVCWSIKVNQVGYRPADASNRAYLGMWLPGIGPMDFSAFAGKEFSVRRFQRGDHWQEGKAVGEPVFRGKITLRRTFADQNIPRDGGANLTGEDVYEMDLSGLSIPGEFCIHIPGLGRSWPFRVDRNVWGEAFYTVMKGLFTQRCGTALTQPFTAWERGVCHAETLPGRFLPETESWYRGAYRKGDVRYGFRDESGAQIGVSSFTVVGNSDPAAKPVPGLRGGWHDAADFDRRIYHYNVVWDLLGAFESNQKALGDSQLHIPESGNGIPDILDEALWGIEVWRRTQTPEGAVSSWIEEKSHPGMGRDLQETIGSDPLKMFVSVPDRAGSFAYAAAAAWAGRLLRPFDQKRAETFIESAARAFDWADRAENAIRGWEMELVDGGRDAKLKGQKLRFDEDPQMQSDDNGPIDRAFAALHLYQATGTQAYLDAWGATPLAREFGRVAHRVNPCRLVPLFNPTGSDLPGRDLVLETLRRNADALIAAQGEHAYRMLWLSPKDGWFHTLAWGNYHSKLRLLGTVAALTGEPRYRESLASGASFFLGCNPMGTTLVSGLGSVFPVVFQHLHSQSDGIAEPTPGIAPYWFTYGVAMNAFLLADGGHASVKSFYPPTAVAFVPDILGRKQLQEHLDRSDKTGDWVKETGKPVRDAVWKNWPVFRRHTTHPGSVVEQNEFTVGETISPLAFAFAILTGEGWTPARELRERRPRTDLRNLPYYGQP